jgi:hypothetical protein
MVLDECTTRSVDPRSLIKELPDARLMTLNSG